MNKDLLLAKEILGSGFSCALCKNEQVFKSTLRGVKPLLDFLDSGENFIGFSAADKVVGKGAAFLYVLLNIRIVYAQVISVPAAKIFDKNGISYTYGEIVPAIKNRSNTGFCPIEAALWDINNPSIALDKIKETLLKLS